VRILGVDPGTRICGYAVIEVLLAGEPRYLECGVITAGAALPIERRLAAIALDLRGLIDDVSPRVVAVEDVFSARNVRSAFALAQARGAVLAVAGMAGIPVHSYAPALVKKTVTGRGRASKDQVARMVQVLVGLRRPPRSDAADALAVALTHARMSALTGRLG